MIVFVNANTAPDGLQLIQETLDDQVGIALAPIVINQVDVHDPVPDPDEVNFCRAQVQVDDAIHAARFRRTRHDVQRQALDQLTTGRDTSRVVLPRRVAPAAPGVAHLARERHRPQGVEVEEP